MIEEYFTEISKQGTRAVRSIHHNIIVMVVSSRYIVDNIIEQGNLREQKVEEVSCTGDAFAPPLKLRNNSEFALIKKIGGPPLSQILKLCALWLQCTKQLCTAALLVPSLEA